MTLSYIWERFWKKIPGSAIRDSAFEKPFKIGSQSTVIHTKMGRYSYCGYYCTLINCQIGRYCSIADYVCVGLASHPVEWLSTSPAFYQGGGGAAPAALGTMEYPPSSDNPLCDEHIKALTVIGNDVWIGQNVLIKPSIVIGDGAVIGMGSVVTNDVPPYAIVAGNPARLIRMRFTPELVEQLERSKWWELDPLILKQFSHSINNPKVFLESLKSTDF